jgi:hypothetical protein
MRRRHFVLMVLGSALGAACSADAAQSMVVYKNAS